MSRRFVGGTLEGAPKGTLTRARPPHTQRLPQPPRGELRGPGLGDDTAEPFSSRGSFHRRRGPRRERLQPPPAAHSGLRLPTRPPPQGRTHLTKPPPTRLRPGSPSWPCRSSPHGPTARRSPLTPGRLPGRRGPAGPLPAAALRRPPQFATGAARAARPAPPFPAFAARGRLRAVR